MQQFSKLLLAAMLGGAITLGGYKLVFEPTPNVSFLQAQRNVTLANYEKQASQNFTVPEGLNFLTAAKRTTVSVVHIKTYFKHKDSEWFGSKDEGFYARMSSGSGVIISADGFILTNHHVVEDAKKIEVILDDKRSYTGTLVGTDANTDLALLKIQAENLDPINFGNSDQVQVGEWVLAVGNPFDLTSTVTAGIISAKGRNISVLNHKEGLPIESFIQTDAAVNPGNSGGALVNLRGELIGINTAIATRTGAYAGYSFAVPTALARKVAEDLRKFGQVQRGILGIGITDVTAKIAQEEGLAEVKGVLVLNVNKGSGAAQAGIEIGDVITGVEGTEVGNVANLQELIGRHQPGEKVQVQILRKGQTKQLAVMLKNKNNETELIRHRDSFAEIGAEVEEISAKEAQKYNISGGLKVLQIFEGSFKKQEVPIGFIITHVDKEQVKTVANLRIILNAGKEKLIFEGIDANGEKAFYGIGF